MSWIARYYNRRTRGIAESDFLRHVGHTEHGKPISPEKLQRMLDQVAHMLALDKSDVLLDLCCGNGVVTKPLATRVQSVVGVDFSEELIRLAQTHHQAANLSYGLSDVKKLGDVRPEGRVLFSKVLMNAGLQHFSPQDFDGLLPRLMSQSQDDARFLFAFVPDAGKRAAFDASFAPDLSVRLRRWMGRDLLGAWWHRDEVSEICAKHGLSVQFSDIDPSFAGGRHRMDILVSR